MTATAIRPPSRSARPAGTLPTTAQLRARLERVVKARRMSELSAMSGVNLAALMKIRTGETSNTSLDLAAKLWPHLLALESAQDAIDASYRDARPDSAPAGSSLPPN